MEDQVVIRKSNFGYWALGLVFGSLVGGTVALLMAPQSGMQTRAQLAQTSGQVRDRAKDMMGDATNRAKGMVGDARSRVSDVAGQARTRVGQVISNMSPNSGSPTTTDKLVSTSDELNREADILESDIDKNYDL